VTCQQLPDLSLGSSKSGRRAILHVGFDQIRLLAPLQFGDRIRGKAELRCATFGDRGVEACIRVTIESAIGSQPAGIVEPVMRYLKRSTGQPRDCQYDSIFALARDLLSDA
jgi:acyl dehydratase